MPDLLKPRDEADVRDAVAWAVAESRRLEIVGHGSKRAIGRPAQTDATMDLSALSGITLYEPDELVLSAHAGTPLAEIEAALAAENQELAFEPMRFGPLFGAAGADAARGTLGGTVAANISGPRRIKAGAARDHVLGIRAVSGRGEIFKSGGRVVKNVTGYDLSKGLSGSWGTLAVLAQVTVKVLPAAEACETVVVTGLDDAAASRAMAAAMGSPAEVSGAAHLPAPAAARAGLGAGGAVTCLRLEGFGPSVAARREALVALMAPFGPVETIGREASQGLWRAIRDAALFDADRTVWRLSVAPTAGHAVVADIARACDAEAFYDWAGGLVWLAVPQAAEGHEGTVRAAVRAAGGHALLVRADDAVRAAVPVFEPQEAGLAALSKRLKEAFDPQAVLNPGRMYPGI